MVSDITKAIDGNEFKNGTGVVTCSRTGNYSVLNTYVKNTPTLTDIENKFDNRFDDPSYYYGSNGVDGGDVA